jgi:hypothetical protein
VGKPGGLPIHTKAREDHKDMFLFFSAVFARFGVNDFGTSFPIAVP